MVIIKEKVDPEFHIPIIDCPDCGYTNVPLCLAGPFLSDGKVITIWHCCNCSYLPKSPDEYKGYTSQFEIDKTDWEAR